MSDETNPEVLSIFDASRPPSFGLSIDEILKDPTAAGTAFLQFVEATKASVAEFLDTQKQLTVICTDAQAKLAEIAVVGTQAVAAKTQIGDAQAIIATKSEHIQKAQEHADTVRANLDRAFTAATQSTTAISAEKDKAESFSAEAAALFSDVQKSTASAEAENVAAEKARESAETSAEVSKGLADKSATIEERVAGYEKRLAELEGQCSKQLETITGLLPGATSAGLAQAFDQRRQTFLKPQGRWQTVFICSVVAIVLLAVTGLWHVYKAGVAPTYDELIRLWLSRLPVAGALVWLALHASREAALAKRLEEDYGYKSATASCFEGFQKQMSEIGEAAVAGSPLTTLCENTLQTIASPPGRIYDKHKLTVSPTDELRDAAKTVADAAAAIKTP
jgi:hypothetical protein